MVDPLNIRPLFSLAALVENYRRNRYLWVTRKADLVIEAYPRSASTFLYRIVRAATQRSTKIAHHVHRPQQVSVALRYGINTAVIIRHPYSAVASYMVYQKNLDARTCIKRYIAFYSTIEAYMSDDLLHLLEFEKVINDPATVVNLILRRAALPYELNEHIIQRATEDNRADVSRSSLPNVTKDRLKADCHMKIVKEPQLEPAIGLYNRIKKGARRI